MLFFVQKSFMFKATNYSKFGIIGLVFMNGGLR